MTALQHLPPRQRAVLVLRVLLLAAADVAELLDTSVASVNSALQRARATLATLDVEGGEASVDAGQQELLARYVDAFERYDIEALVALLHDDAIMSMPPYDFWLQGSGNMARWFSGPGAGCEGSRLVPVQASGRTGFGAYRADPEGGHGVRDPGDRGLRGPDRRPPQLRRPRSLPDLRPAGAPRGLAARPARRRPCR